MRAGPAAGCGGRGGRRRPRLRRGAAERRAASGHGPDQLLAPRSSMTGAAFASATRASAVSRGGGASRLRSGLAWRAAAACRNARPAPRLRRAAPVRRRRRRRPSRRPAPPAPSTPGSDRKRPAALLRRFRSSPAADRGRRGAIPAASRRVRAGPGSPSPSLRLTDWRKRSAACSRAPESWALVCSRVACSVCAVRSRSLAAVSRMVSNWPATAIDAPLVAEARVALISCARACALAKLSSTLAANRPSVASNASLRPERSPMSACRLLWRCSRAWSNECCCWARSRPTAARVSACWASCPASAPASDWVAAEIRPSVATCEAMAPSACWNSSTRAASPL